MRRTRNSYKLIFCGKWWLNSGTPRSYGCVTLLNLHSLILQIRKMSTKTLEPLKYKDVGRFGFVCLIYANMWWWVYFVENKAWNTFSKRNYNVNMSILWTFTKETTYVHSFWHVNKSSSLILAKTLKYIQWQFSSGLFGACLPCLKEWSAVDSPSSNIQDPSIGRTVCKAAHRNGSIHFCMTNSFPAVPMAVSPGYRRRNMQGVGGVTRDISAQTFHLGVWCSVLSYKRRIIPKYSVRTANETQSVTITEIKCLMLFIQIIIVYSDNSVWSRVLDLSALGKG